MRNRADEIIYLIRTHPGYGFRNVPVNILIPFIRYEWESERWVMITEKNGRILGWVSWYHFDKPSLKKVKDTGIIECFLQKIPLKAGPHVYLANCVICEDAPPDVCRRLYQMASNATAGFAETINAHMCNREDGHARWMSHPIRQTNARMYA